MAAQLAAASDYRVFALAALQRTEQGGAFYASYVADYCYFNRPELTRLAQATMAEDVRRESTVSPARLAVLGKHASRCANFSPEEAERIAREAGARKRDGRDPLAALQRAVISSALTTHVVPRQLVASLLASSDPLLLSSADLLFMVMRAQPGASEQQGLWFEGKLMPLAELEAGEIVQAVRLASCRDGLPCALDTEMLIACMQGSVCEEDRVAYVLAYWRAIGGPQESEPRILALAGRIRSAIERRDVSTFVAPN